MSSAEPDIKKNESIVSIVYNSLLKRDPEAEGKRNAIEYLKSGGTPRELVASVLKSKEYNDLVVLERNALTESIIESAEKLPVDEKIELMYTRILGRSSDKGGKRGLTNYFNNGGATRDAVVNMMNSKEYKEKSDSGYQIHSLLNKDYYFDYKRTSKYTVKYIGPIGTSGYCKVVKFLVLSLITQGVDVIFQPITMHESIDNPDDDDRKLLSLTSDRSYDVLIIHSVPTEWPYVIQKEREKYGVKPVYGITVWEADNVPSTWIDPLNMASVVSVPNIWNKDVFSKHLKVPVETLYHPVEQNPRVSGKYKKNKPYTFYTINEWRHRKGVTDVVNCYLEEFTSKDDVVLYVKTFGRAVGEYLEITRKKLDFNSPKIIFNTDNVPTDEIHKIHANGDCYITLAKAEGQGLGACEAAVYNKPIITNSYGAQTEYVRGAFNVSYSIIPAVMCDETSVHDKCTESICLFAPEYEPLRMNWSQPNLEEAKLLMRWMYENRVTEGNPYTKKFMETFSLETVGANLDASLQKLI